MRLTKLYKIQANIDAEYSDWPTGPRDGFPVIKSKVLDILVGGASATDAIKIALASVPDVIEYVDPFDKKRRYLGNVAVKTLLAAVPMNELPVGQEVLIYGEKAAVPELGFEPTSPDRESHPNVI